MKYDIAIVGSGFCGTLAAINLARQAAQAKIALIERNAVHGPGLAYGTADADHLLNVRAGQMGAFPEDPGHFWRWLETSGHKGGYTPQDFLPRRIYGQYIRDLLAQAASPFLQPVNKRITDISSQTGHFILLADDGTAITADKVILALGNFPPDQLGQSEAQNPYAPEVWRRAADEGDVLIVGTGLTSLDLVVTLAKTKPKGKIHLLSRHGLLPREHADTMAWPLSFNATALRPDVRQVLRALRKEIALAADQGVSWHNVIDAMRPYTQSLWQALGDTQRRRFLRHLRAYWDVHRHRCAAPIMEAYRGLEKQGRLELHRGHVMAQTENAAGWEVDYRPRGSTRIEHLQVRHLLRCTGPQADFRRLSDTLVQNLLRKGMIVSDPLHMGIATTDDYAVIGVDGAKTPGLYAIGSVLKGRLYESVAVPELRGQAADVSASVCR